MSKPPPPSPYYFKRPGRAQKYHIFPATDGRAMCCRWAYPINFDNDDPVLDHPHEIGKNECAECVRRYNATKKGG